MMRKRLHSCLTTLLIAAALVYLLFCYIPGRIVSQVYQKKYVAEVERYSREFSVDPALVYSVIKVESDFNPDAKSDVGAIGLMQIIEDSFDWVAMKLDRGDLEFSDMYTPEYSIMFGCYMLSYLYERYGSIELTAAAYHSGMGTVDRWIAAGEVDPENVSAADIQGSNTSHYVRKILRAYGYYTDK